MNTLRKISENFNIDNSYKGLILLNESLASKTTFKVGGKAKYYAQPQTSDDLLLLLEAAQKQNIKWFILGGGSNLVINDEGFDGLVISTRQLDFCKTIKENENLYLSCGSGCTFKAITEYTIQNALTGLESFAGLPGTTGGSVFMNARCYDVSISDVLYSVKYISVKNDGTIGDISEYLVNNADWAYKKSPFQNTKNIIVSVNFKIDNGDKDTIKQKSDSYIQDRITKGHFKYPSAGSVFKNNHDFGSPSGKIIDEVGLRGFSVGGAQVAPWHGNFIINTGKATASDISNLVQKIKDTVKEKKGFSLECEIIFTDK